MFFAQLNSKEKREATIDFFVSFSAGYVSEITGNYNNEEGYPSRVNTLAIGITLYSAIPNFLVGDKKVAATQVAISFLGFALGSFAGACNRNLFNSISLPSQAP